jgi:hypothetical protein
MATKAVAASMVEYALLLFAVLIVAATPLEKPPAATTTKERLVTSVQNASLAAEAGDRSTELAWIGSASGATSALIGFTAPCEEENCETVRDMGQEILGLLARRKSALVGGSCGNGVIEGLKQCDPSAVPTGCETTTAPSFCSTDCLCVPATGTP